MKYLVIFLIMLLPSVMAETRIQKVIPQNNWVLVYYQNWNNGKPLGAGGTRSHQGKLVQWSSNMVTTNQNGFVKTYDADGRIVSTYKE